MKREGNEKIEIIKSYISFMPQEKTTNNNPIPPMHTTLYLMLNRGVIQLMLTVGSFHTSPFLIVV
jgi:hypothetical protein